MKFQLTTIFGAVMATLVGLAAANTPIDGSTMEAYLADRGGFEVAMAARPYWHFGLMRPAFYLDYFPMCWPSPALVNGQQHGNQPDKWPKAGTGCPPANTPFPTYYNIKRCSADEIRVIYSIYYEHDGFSNVLIAKGHEHDWERVVVIWRRDPSTNLWRRHRVLFSMHSGYTANDWAKVAHTFDFSNINEEGGKDKDGFRVYPGWAKHANFEKRETGWRDTVSQGCQREYRSDNYKYLPRPEDLVLASKDSDMGVLLSGFDWGGATSGPWVVEDGICGKDDGGFVEC